MAAITSAIIKPIKIFLGSPLMLPGLKLNQKVLVNSVDIGLQFFKKEGVIIFPDLKLLNNS